MTGSADLTAALRAHARGLHCLQAAVELLISHASWLRQSDFLHEFVHTVPGLIDGTPMAPIDWPDAIAALDRDGCPAPAAKTACSASPPAWPWESPSTFVPRSPAWTAHNADLVCDAVKHATGHR